MLLVTLLVTLFGSIAPLSAHRFFFGITDINVNHKTKHIEIIHQFTLHDVENLIAQQQQVNFSPEHPQYEQLIRQYFEKHFKIQNNSTSIKLDWIGLELVRDKLFIYQEAKYPNFLIGLVVKNGLLTNTYAKQVNTVNFQDNDIRGSLTFGKSQQVAKIIANH
ncbi:MAG: hypothetical protein COB35_04040 [Gammaproteobacteria bacterium]|nr:MAG: hypothetical protein COB35_04040 [Gammaproteobacteria bacterium]